LKNNRDIDMIGKLKRYIKQGRGRVAMLAVAAVVLTACEPQVTEPPAPRPVFAMRVADTSGLAERAFPGRARAGQEVNRSFRVAGPLISLPVAVGDEVKAGDVLARIDPQDFETKLRTLEGQLAQEQANLKRAQADLSRLERIYREDPGATSQATIDKARQVRDSAQAGVRSIEASVQNARDQLSYTELEAPFDGVVVETYVSNFETVVAKQPILRLLDPSRIEFVIQVAENLISLAPYVEKVTVSFDALPAVQVPATVKEIGKEASQATRTYPVTLVMDQPPGTEILPGMAGRASIVSRPPAESALLGIQIPATAVFSGDGPDQSFVWVVDEAAGTLSRRHVKLGKLARFGVLIQSGLNAGEWVVTKGVHSLREGQRVRILDASGRATSS
jgi:RND family efflux transporter MFP subunit